MHTITLKDDITALHRDPASFTNAQVQALLSAFVAALNAGSIRVASLDGDAWRVHPWVKQGILALFRHQSMSAMPGTPKAFDKVALKFSDLSTDDFRAMSIRAVPGAIVRDGCHIGEKTVLMPCFINVGAYIGSGTMIDTWATVGSCAQIGQHVHISGGWASAAFSSPKALAPSLKITAIARVRSHRRRRDW